MALTKTPVCDFGKKAEDFKLKSVKNEIISLNDVKGEKATLIMFICNHCPYVKAIIHDLTKDCKELKKYGINFPFFANVLKVRFVESITLSSPNHFPSANKIPEVKN